MSNIAEQDIKQTRRTEDKAVNSADDMMSIFALNIGQLLKKGDADITLIKHEVENALNEAGFDETINGVTNQDYQELINQSHTLYTKITGDKNIVITDEEVNGPENT